jgi:two-component system, chemotaxis family, sensor kinase Cph1
MRAIVPDIDRPFTFRGIEIRPEDTPELFRQKLARIVQDARFQLVVVLSTDGVVIELRNVVASDETLLGDDSIGVPLWEAFRWPNAHKIPLDLRDATVRAANGEVIRVDAQLGEFRVIDITIAPVRDSRGAVVLLMLEGRDVTANGHRDDARFRDAGRPQDSPQPVAAAADATEQRRAEQEFVRLTAHSEQQRRLYQTILSSTPDLVYVFDLNHRFTYANEALLTLWGKTADEAIGRNCLELGYEPWHAAMHDREIEQVIATKLPLRGEVPFQGTGDRRIYDYIFVPVLDANGEVEAIAGTTRDVTERKLAEQKVRDSEERLRFMAESMPHKIFTANPSGEMDYFSRQWMEFTGLTFADLQGSNWTRVVHPDDAPESLRLWQRSVDTAQPFQAIHRFRRVDGVYRWHLTRIHAMLAAGGKIMMWIGSSTEIHEQKHAEEELRRANQDLEQFAYAASHDLQEPLRGIKIYSELLTKNYARELDREGLQFLHFVKNGATRMEMLVRDLLAYTQVVQVDKPSMPADAGGAVNVALANLAGAIEESVAQVTVDPLPSLYVHPTHLQQLFQNLLGNAIKYRRPDTVPIIHVSAVRERTRWVITVADNGIGIDMEYKDEIFGLFKRLHTHDRYSGTGIGLALCHRIVERNQGCIWVESEPGVGSRFHFAFPV